MTRATPTARDKSPRPIPGRIGGVLKVLQALIAHARYFAATVPDRAEVPDFAAVAAVFGTYDVPTILHRVRRGILRALALQRYLLARAARGRNLRFGWRPCVALQPHHRPPPKPARASAAHPAQSLKRQPDPATLAPDDPAAFRDLSPGELDAWVRRRPVGRTLSLICMDLGIVPCLCDGDFWCEVEYAMRRYGGSLARMFRARLQREVTFQRERDRRPETWHIPWRGVPRPIIRQVLGCLIGESPPLREGLMPGAPVAVPS